MQREKGGMPAFARFAILAVIGAVIAWRIVVVNMADHYVQRGESDDAAAALKWDPAHPKALYTQALRHVAKDPGEAQQELEAALRANPADGRSYALLARVRESQGDIAAAERAMTTAAAMAPRRVDVQSEVAAFWMKRGNVARAMEHWNVVLTFGRELRPKLFPALLALAEDPATHAAFAPLLKRPVAWWPAFVTHAAANAQRLETVRALFALQAKGPNAATPEALRAFLNRLQREGAWTEAYFVWLNNLPNDQLKTIGNLFNGGFEEPISNLGFDWISAPAGQVLVEAAATYGTTGGRALHVVFRGPRVAYRHLSQHLMLAPGTYSMRGRVRPENLETERGVQWAVYCVSATAPLATSERFAGTDQWRHFSFQFAVPAADCLVQVVRLELAGRVALDFEAKGGVWFDDLAIDRQSRID